MEEMLTTLEYLDGAGTVRINHATPASRPRAPGNHQFCHHSLFPLFTVFLVPPCHVVCVFEVLARMFLNY